MPNPWFSKMQLIGYDIDGSGEKTLAVDILQRIKFRNVLLNDYLIFYTYVVKDGETPEIIAEKLYGNAQYHWIVLLANNIIDPIYDWPMSQENLINTIHSLYDTPVMDGLIYAYQTVDHYEDSHGNTIDLTSYQKLPVSMRKVVMIYDQMVADNEAKRSIQLLDPKFVTQVDAEADTIQQQALL